MIYILLSLLLSTSPDCGEREAEAQIALCKAKDAESKQVWTEAKHARSGEALVEVSRRSTRAREVAAAVCQKADELERERQECVIKRDVATPLGLSCEQLAMQPGKGCIDCTGFEANRARIYNDRVRQAAADCAQQAAAQDAQKADERRALIDGNPKAVRAAASLAICYQAQEEAEFLKSIAKTKKDSQIAGVVSLRDLKELQDEVVKRRERQAFVRARLKERKLKPLPCGDPTVSALWACAANEIEGCHNDDVDALLDYSDGFIAAADAAD